MLHLLMLSLLATAWSCLNCRFYPRVAAVVIVGHVLFVPRNAPVQCSCYTVVGHVLQLLKIPFLVIHFMLKGMKLQIYLLFTCCSCSSCCFMLFTCCSCLKFLLTVVTAVHGILTLLFLVDCVLLNYFFLLLNHAAIQYNDAYDVS